MPSANVVAIADGLAPSGREIVREIELALGVLGEADADAPERRVQDVVVVPAAGPLAHHRREDLIDLAPLVVARIVRSARPTGRRALVLGRIALEALTEHR